MFRMVLALACSVATSVMCGSFLLLNKSWNENAEESARHSRVVLQSAEQNLARVRQAVERRWITALAKDQDSLKVDFAMQMRELSIGKPDLSLAFEQQLMSDFPSNDDAVMISVLALHIRYIADHGPDALGILNDIGRYVEPWPYEIRACQLFRANTAGLTVDCMMHVYHWPITPAVAAS